MTIATQGSADERAGQSVLYTRACQLFGVRYPIVQTGMGWVSGARLTAATSAAGGLGILGAATMTIDELRAAIDEVKAQTDAPFGVNFRPAQENADEVVDLIIRKGVRVASFAQAPTQAIVDTLKSAGVVTMPTIGAQRHAEKVAKWGVDAVIAQGQEGGGHTGQVPTALLLQQVCGAIDIPVLAAGGFNDGRGLIAALAYGASGVAMGTRFLLTAETAVPSAIKGVYLETAVDGTVVTKRIDGYPQRVIRTKVIERLERSNWLTRFFRAMRYALRFRKVTGTSFHALLREGLAMKRRQGLTWSQVAMAANAPMLTRASMVDGRQDVGILPTGQVVGVIDELPTVAELIERIVEEAEATLARLGALAESKP